MNSNNSKANLGDKRNIANHYGSLVKNSKESINK